MLTLCAASLALAVRFFGRVLRINGVALATIGCYLALNKYLGKDADEATSTAAYVFSVFRRELPPVFLIELRQALVSYQDHHMLP